MERSGLMTDRELVSIIMPVYNVAEFLEETVASVLAQTYRDWELILVDDGSVDDSSQIMADLVEKDSRIIALYMEENGGQARARNAAIEKARGRYIAFLDSDDLWLPEKLAKQVNFIQQHHVGLCYSDYAEFEGERNIVSHIKAPDVVGSRRIYVSNAIPCLTAMYDAEKCGKVYMKPPEGTEDWALWIKLIKLSGPALNVGEELALYRVHAGGHSSNKMKMLRRVARFHRENNGFNPLTTLVLLAVFLTSHTMKRLRTKFRRWS